MIIKRFRNVYTPLGAVGRVGVKKQMDHHKSGTFGLDSRVYFLKILGDMQSFKTNQEETARRLFYAEPKCSLTERHWTKAVDILYVE